MTNELRYIDEDGNLQFGEYEHLMNKNKNVAYTRYENQKIYNKIEERTACKICERLNKGIRYHPEAAYATILPNELSEDCIHSDWIRDKERALNNTPKSHYYNKMCYDAKRKNREFKVGDMVYVENGNKLNRKKLEELRIGPYKIEKKSDTIYEIDTGHRKTESNLFHISKLIPVQITKDEVEEDTNEKK
ncbi:hypothetical protein HELRODRAFT_182682 [Helobdella robusta]|uniref:Uncharacterized protein n=1 Tax=Helobdella robusta TaxID=6412 RepID=T1FIK7_HELRO|nr:hypothetical protein HELRODRAFT_182682 [Helobdella robusta]ESN90191.1 hypothetical protein HELRODRAFT_182682 [Helobdella robusta]